LPRGRARASAAAGAERGEGAPASDGDGGSGGAKPPGVNDARLIARDDKKNPLISVFDWTDDATQRIFRVPAGFMRSKTQERIEELARERAAEAIDLALVEDGIEIGKRMMAEMIATYSPPGKNPVVAAQAREAATPPASVQDAPSGGGYLNEVRTLSATPRQD